MSKRFIVAGQTEIDHIEEEIAQVQTLLNESRSAFIRFNKFKDNFSHDQLSTRPDTLIVNDITTTVRTRYKRCTSLLTEISRLQHSTSQAYHPANKLQQAIHHATQRGTSIETSITQLNLAGSTASDEFDPRITMGAKMLAIKLKCSVVEDKLLIFASARASRGLSDADSTFVVQSLLTSAQSFLDHCEAFIVSSRERKLARLTVEASLCYARVVKLSARFNDALTAGKIRTKAEDLLEEAKDLCVQAFLGADILADAVDLSLKLFQREWYAEVTAEELEAIKEAMVTGPRGIATHSGHWYNCANGHPVR